MMKSTQFKAAKAALESCRDFFAGGFSEPHPDTVKEVKLALAMLNGRSMSSVIAEFGEGFVAARIGPR